MGHCCGNRSRVDSLDGLRRLWNEHDVIAQAAQALDQPGGGALTRDLIEVALAEFAEGLAGGQHVEHGDEQLVSDGHQGPHGAAARAQAVVFVTVVAALGRTAAEAAANRADFRNTLPLRVAAPLGLPALS